MDEKLKREIKNAFENTVLCARANPPSEAYGYGERMALYIIKLIEDNLIINN